MSIDLHGISRETFEDVLEYEVSGEAGYRRRFTHPIWPPGGRSGVTVAIGYDLGTQSKEQIHADWEGKVDDKALSAMMKCAGIRGPAARQRALDLHWIAIPWETALAVYTEHDLPRYVEICRHYLPGFDALHPHCKGALFSLTLNRDAGGFVKRDERYAEMRGIREAIKSGNLARVPGLLRSMKRLWPGEDERGLITRREKEARRFEQGLAAGHVEAHDQLAHEKDPVNPDVVASVQRQLKALGYFQVGAVDGSKTQGGKLEDAILAFRNRNGLPLSADIDDDLIQALAHARPPEVSEARQTADVEDLRAEGSETIAFTDKAKTWAGRIFGGSIGGGGLLAWLTENMTKVQDAHSAFAGLGLSPRAMAIIVIVVVLSLLSAAAGLGIWYVAHRIEQKRLHDYRTGKNT